MRLAFLDRQREIGRLSALFDDPPGLAVLYGRRRLGKSRLAREAVSGRPSVYYVGDARDAALQRRAVAQEVQRLLPGFADVDYPDWAPLLSRLWREAPEGTVVVLDELPELVLRSPSLPATLQKLLDESTRRVSLVLAGSSQRMMHGLVLDGSAPLYGRAKEIIRVAPLPAGWIREGLGVRSARQSVEHFAAWGGVPRYWELARQYPSRRDAFDALVLDPLGVLHREPDRLLLDDTTDVTRSASILALVGRGCHRVSEIAARLGRPSTSLSHPLNRLLDLGLLQREVPFGRSARDTKRTYYRIADPFLRAWYRIVEPNRSRLEAGMLAVVAEESEASFEHLVGEAWEELARQSAPRLVIDGSQWEPASRWWGRSREGPLELDLVCQAVGDPDRVLVGEAKRTSTKRQARLTLEELREKALACPALTGKKIVTALWVVHPRSKMDGLRVIDAEAVMGCLR